MNFLILKTQEVICLKQSIIICLSELSHVQGKSQRHRGTRGGGGVAGGSYLRWPPFWAASWIFEKR